MTLADNGDPLAGADHWSFVSRHCHDTPDVIAELLRG